MNQIPEHVYNKISVLTKEICEEFRRKGIVLPARERDGSVKIGNLKITKDSRGYYNIVWQTGHPVASCINLPQTAILVANRMALGKGVDDKLLEADKQYGYAEFEETLQKRYLDRSKDIDRSCLMLGKLSVSRAKKEQNRRIIISSFEKLRKFV
jgi:hypothetical protein